MGDGLKFFTWEKNDPTLNLIFFSLTLFVLIFLILFYKDFSTQQTAALVFTLLIITALPYWSLAQVLTMRISNSFLASGGMGSGFLPFSIALAAGAGIGLFITFGKLSVEPAAAISTAQPFFNFFYTVIAAPVAEELFFRLFLFFIFLKIGTLMLESGVLKPLGFLRGHESAADFTSGIFAAVMVSLVFVSYHYFLPSFSSQDVLARAVGNFIFSMLAIFGNSIFRSGIFGVSMHVTGNLINFVRLTGGG